MLNKLSILLVFVIFFILKQKIKKDLPSQIKQDIVINILTRTGQRESCFKNLEKSIKNQTYKNIRHLKSNDNPDCKFLKGKTDVFPVKKEKKYYSTHCPYNGYLNLLKSKVKEGWVIILDDDAKLSDNTFIEKLVHQIKNTKNKALIYDVFNNSIKKIMPNKQSLFKKEFDVNSTTHGNIDMAGIVFHHSIDINFPDACSGDYIFFMKLLDNKLVEYVNIKPGIWSNYSGNMSGKSIICQED